MAVCAWCRNEMTTGASCTVGALHVQGLHFDLARSGSEAGAGRSAAARCGDCGVRRGGLHHPGCDLQRCPRCRGQLLSCDCPFDEYGLRGDADEDDDPDDDWGDDWDDGDEPATGNISAIDTVIMFAPYLATERLRAIVARCLDQRWFTLDEAWARLGQADLHVHVGAELVRDALRRVA